MALAHQEDVENRLGRDLTEVELTRLDSLLEDASAVVAGYCRRPFDAPQTISLTVIGVVAKMVARVYVSGSAAFTESETIGPSTVRYSAAAVTGDVWLTAADKIALRPFRSGGGMSSVALASERYNPTPDQG